MRQVGRQADRRLRPAPQPFDRLLDQGRLGRADQDGDDLDPRQQALDEDQRHFQAVLAGERPRVDLDAVERQDRPRRVLGDRRDAERRRPGFGRMERDAVERNAMVGAEDDDALQPLGRVEGAQRLGGDAAGKFDPGVGDDDHLGPERAGRRGGEGVRRAPRSRRLDRRDRTSPPPGRDARRARGSRRSFCLRDGPPRLSGRRARPHI